jgi:hypothetical protein
VKNRVKKTSTYLAGVLLAMLAGGGAPAQDLPATPSVEAFLSADSLMIGDQFTLDVEVEKDLTQVIDFPSFFNEEGTPGLIGETVEVLAELPLDTLARDGRRVRIRKRYLLTAFEAGHYNLGRFPALYLDKNIVDTLYASDSLRFFMDTFPIDTLTMDIRDIGAPMPAPVRTGEWLGWALLGLLFAQLVVVAAYILRHRPKKAAAPRTRRPAEPSHVTAIRALEKLQGEKLWQNQRHKLYYTRLTDIVREYIEGRYGVGAMEMTSDEIVDALNEMNIPERSHGQIRRLLTTADYVKFAKYVPDAAQNDLSWNDAYYFIEETKRMVAAPEPAEEEAT